ncbi:DUF975 family protein [Streptococcus equinus]|uniref:DUF975 family protein n=1 Tax=Streptococcus equinus TaxID=1335 RepID=UPI0008B33C58|nr:DUF975 family protein [Streptococcus equinus]SEQ11104.1 Uncharacterized membrane protein [Streptococcus equinus]SFC25032.1 Uncharacterized membrane protein [Streptococcus equinus]
MNASTASEIRSKARKALFVPGKVPLYLFPVILYIISPLILFEISTSIFRVFMHQAFPVDIIFWGLGLLSFFLLTSANFALLDSLRGYREKVGISDNGIAFSKEIFGKLFATSLVKWFYLILWMWPTGIAILYLLYEIKYGFYAPGIWANVVVVIFFSFIFGGIILSIIKSYSYSMTSYILYDQIKNGTYTNPNNVIKRSKELMDGNRWRYFCLQFSFIGWNVLAYIFWAIMNFYVFPYRQAAQIVFYEELLELERKSQLLK